MSLKYGINISKRVSLLNPFSLQFISRRHYPEVRKRFYKNVTVAGTSNLFEVNLDEKKLKTPFGHILQVPNYPLALAVASEWMSVDKKIIPGWMHLTGLAFTTVDNPQKLSRSDIVEKIIDYLETDTILFKEPKDGLLQRQTAEWDPVVEWFNARTGARLHSSEGLCGSGVTGEAKDQIRKYFMSYDSLWALNGILFGVEAVKSVILTTACLERRITAEKAAYLSLLETEFQTDHWGSVEWSHDLDKYALLSRFSAAVLFVHLNSSLHTRKAKSAQAGAL